MGSKSSAPKTGFNRSYLYELVPLRGITSSKEENMVNGEWLMVNALRAGALVMR